MTIGNREPGSKASASRPLAFFELTHEAFLEATRAVGEATRDYVIGGRPVRIRFAGEAMLPMVAPAIAHLASSTPAEPDLTICVWDSASTGVQMPQPLWRPEDHLPRGQIFGFDDERIRTANIPGLDGFSVFDGHRNLAVHWNADARRISYHERSFPLRIIISWWANMRGLQFAHAGAVGLTDGGVLIVGKSGVGKSTTTLACLGSELVYAGDDHVLLAKEPQAYAHSMYCSAKLEADQISNLPHLEPLIENSTSLDEEKALLFTHRAYPEKVSQGFPVRAILIPRISGKRDTRLAKTSAAEGLRALAPSSLLLLPGEDQRAFRNLAEFVKKVPSYTLELGTDLSQIPRAIMSLLRDV